MTRPYINHLEDEFGIEFESLESICKLENKMQATLPPLETNSKDLSTIEIHFLLTSNENN
jgi:hypothetical protein